MRLVSLFAFLVSTSAMLFPVSSALAVDDSWCGGCPEHYECVSQIMPDGLREFVCQVGGEENECNCPAGTVCVPLAGGSWRCDEPPREDPESPKDPENPGIPQFPEVPRNPENPTGPTDPGNPPGSENPPAIVPPSLPEFDIMALPASFALAGLWLARSRKRRHSPKNRRSDQ